MQTHSPRNSNLKLELLHDEDPYHIETSPLIYRANQCTSFYMVGTFIMKELINPFN